LACTNPRHSTWKNANIDVHWVVGMIGGKGLKVSFAVPEQSPGTLVLEAQRISFLLQASHDSHYYMLVLTPSDCLPYRHTRCALPKVQSRTTPTENQRGRPMGRAHFRQGEGSIG
jgi:hypothetical protein